MQSDAASNVPNTSGTGSKAQVPEEIRGWNWGAFFLTWIWGLGNATYIALLALLPVVSLVMPFVLGARGSSWTWRNRRWESVEHFKRVQRSWAIWGLALFLPTMAYVLGGAVTTALPRFRQSQLQTARTGVRAVQHAAAQYSLTQSTSCPSVHDLVAAKYLEADKPDPWGHPYRIVCADDEVVTYSNGPDGQADTADDVHSP